MISFIRRLKVMRHVRLASEKAEFYFAKNVRFSLGEGASIEVRGRVTIGFPLPGAQLGYPGHSETIIEIGKNGHLVLEDDVFIANGSGVYIGAGATMRFKGNNFIAHNATLICKSSIEVGKNSSASWNFTAIDDDGHTFHQLDGQPIQRERRPLVIGDNVAIHMNVVIPRGLNIGDSSIIGANTVVRQDIPANCLAYSKPELRVREGVTYGLQFIDSSLK